MINYKQLFYFWNVAKYGGVTRAAEQLHLTPQTISGQVSELEQALGTNLFQRSGRRLELTAAGKQALTHADEIFQIGKELEALLQGHQEEGAILFRVGVSNVVPKSIAYRLLNPAYQIEEPVRLICHEDKLEHLFADLALHKTDLVIADRPLPTDLGVKGFSHLLGESRTAFYAQPGLAQRYRTGFPQSLDQAPLMLPGTESALRPALDRWLAQQQVQPRIMGEFDDTALMKAFGQEGVGIFPAPEVIADEAARQHDVEIIGCAESLIVRYYAISAERKLRHPAVVAISEAAQTALFVDP
jgi:LysR family transcriptional activator of nhaA